MANYNATLLQQKFAHAIPHDGSVNPFVFVAAALEKGVFPDIPYSFTIQLYITSGIFALCVEWPSTIAARRGWQLTTAFTRAAKQ